MKIKVFLLFVLVVISTTLAQPQVALAQTDSTEVSVSTDATPVVETQTTFGKIFSSVKNLFAANDSWFNIMLLLLSVLAGTILLKGRTLLKLVGELFLLLYQVTAKESDSGVKLSEEEKQLVLAKMGEIAQILPFLKPKE